MKKVIYQKFSNKRRKEYAIRTVILRDENGNRFVRKINIFPEGRENILRMKRCEEALRIRFENTGINVQKSELLDEGIEFSYVSGTPLQIIFKDMIEKEDKAGLKEQLKNYLERISYVPEEKKDKVFQPSEGFIKIFGEPDDIILNTPATDIADIDIIPSNIIVDESKKSGAEGDYTIIDYEWTFNFLIPLKYIKFRCLLFWHNENEGRSLLSWEEMMKLADVSESEERTFRKMEENFQNYILGTDEETEGEDSGKDTEDEKEELPELSFDKLLYYKKQEKERGNFLIYFDKGKGFPERDDITLPAEMFSEGLVTGNFEVPEGTRRIRFLYPKVFTFCMPVYIKTETEKLKFPEEEYLNLEGSLIMDMDLQSETDKGEEIEFLFFLLDLPEDEDIRARASELLKEKTDEKTLLREAYSYLDIKLSDAEDTLEERMNIIEEQKRILDERMEIIEELQKLSDERMDAINVYKAAAEERMNIIMQYQNAVQERSKTIPWKIANAMTRGKENTKMPDPLPQTTEEK